MFSRHISWVGFGALSTSTAMRALLLAVSLVVVPTAVLAQAAIAGVVLDSSGAAVAGVVVEASSPELIEKLRTTITNESGRYPGTWLQPLTILTPRFFKITAEIEL